MITTCILGLWAFLFRLTGGYDSTVPAYIICTILLEQLIKRYKLFDLIELAKDEAIECMKDGLMVLDFDDQDHLCKQSGTTASGFCKGNAP
ncbi:MAG: hypothetical protein V8R67_13360 [Eubacterium sp.]